MIGQIISHYRILEKLGGGGMGVVYKAQDVKLDRFVALKFLPHHLSADSDEKTRFIHEAKTASALDHPNICTIYEIDETADGQMFIAMAYYDGETLKKKVASGQLSVDSAIDIATQIAQGLSRAHEAGITHRDIKPANVMITARGEVKIVDFGLAKLAGRTKLTKSGTTMGTAAYMSPEQAQGAEVDHRTDIWSLGVVLYEMLTGQLPFSGEYEMAMMYSLVNTDPKPVRSLRSEVSVDLEQIVNKALVKKPEERYQKIDEMLADLKSSTQKSESKKTFPTRKLAVGKRWYLYAGLVVLILGVILASIFLRPKPAAAIDSIAVLPLENMTGDPNQEYFVDGMTEALIANLAKINSLRVISRTSIMQYKKARKSLPEIARELNVEAIVEGSVARSDGRVRITAQLIDAPTDRHLWANSYDRDLRDVLALQSEVTTAIVREIQVKLTPQEQQRLTKTRQVNPDAYRLYLKGRNILSNDYNEAVKALECFQQAAQLDPSFAPAYAGQALSYIIMKMNSITGAMSPQEIFPRAKAAALKALQLDATTGEAHSALGQVKFYYEWDWDGPERDFQNALKVDPQNTEILISYSSYLVQTGRFDESIALVKKAIDLAPLSPVYSVIVGPTCWIARRYDDGIAHLRNMLDIYPDAAWMINYHLAWNYVGKRMHQEAIDAAEKSGDLVTRAYVYAVAGKRDEALKLLNELFEKSKREYIEPVFIAQIYIGLGDKEKAFQWLTKAYEEHSPYMTSLKNDATFDPLRSDPRFVELRKKIGLEK